MSVVLSKSGGGGGGSGSGSDAIARKAASDALIEIRALTPQPGETIEAGQSVITPFGTLKAPGTGDVVLNATNPQTLASLQTAGLVPVDSGVTPEALALSLATRIPVVPLPGTQVGANGFLYTPWGIYQAPAAGTTLNDTTPQTQASIEAAGMVLFEAGDVKVTPTAHTFNTVDIEGIAFTESPMPVDFEAVFAANPLIDFGDPVTLITPLGFRHTAIRQDGEYASSMVGEIKRTPGSSFLVELPDATNFALQDENGRPWTIVIQSGASVGSKVREGDTWIPTGGDTTPTNNDAGVTDAELEAQKQELLILIGEQGAVVNTRLNNSNIKTKYVPANLDRSLADGVTIIDETGTGQGQGVLVTNSNEVLIDDYSPDGINDQVAIQAALQAAYILKRNVTGGHYTTSDTVFTTQPASSDSLWTEDTDHSYYTAKIGSITSTHNDEAIRSNGRIIAMRFEIDRLIGPGVLLPYPTVDGGEERIALRLRSGGHNFKIGVIQGFNIGTLFAASWTADIEVGQHVEVAKPVVSRLGDDTGKSQGLKYKALGMGGVFSNINVPNDQLRRDSSADIGADLDYVTQSVFDLGVDQYVMMQADSIALKIGSEAKSNEILGYFEGVRDSGHYIYCRGHNNNIYCRGPLGSPEDSTLTGGVDLGGNGNVLYGVKEMTGDAAASIRTTNGGTSPFIIRQGNRVESHVKMVTLHEVVTDTSNQLSDVDPMPMVFGATVTRTYPNPALNRPTGIDRDVRITRLLISDNQQAFINSPLIIKPLGITSIQVGIAAKNELTDRGFQVAFYVEDENGELYGEGQTMSLPTSRDWNLTQVPVIVPEAVAQLRVKVSIRSGGSDTADNCRGLVLNPWLSFNSNYEYQGDPDGYLTSEQGVALGAELNTKVTAMTWASAELLTSSDSAQVSILDMPRAGLFNVVNTDIAAEVLLDPERGYYLPWAGTDGSQGGLVRDLSETPKARFFGVQFSYPDVTLTAAEITVLDDLNTPKLQAMINWTAHHRRVKCYLGVGKYHFKKLYLTGDASNPGFPDDDLLQGRITLIGESQGSFVNYRGIGGNGGSVGTHLVSSDPIGPALYANGDPKDNDRNLTNKVRVESMGIEANNTTYVVELYRCPQYSGLTDVSIIQRNKDGGGYHQNQKWLTYNHNVVCEYIGTNDGTGIPRNTKIGVLVRNSSTTPNSLSGGFNVMDQIMGQRFRVGVMIGGETRGEGLRDHGYTCVSVQSGQCDTGILLGQGALNVTMSGTHCEGNVIGYHICSGANRVSINGTTSSNQLDMMLGYGTTGIPDVDAVTAAAGHNINSNSADTLDINMRYDSGPETRKNLAIFGGAKNVTIYKPQFANPSAVANPHVEAAIFLEDAAFEGLEIVAPQFTANYPIEIENEIRGATSNAKQSLALIGNGLSTIDTMDVPYAATVYGTNTTNSVYRLINSANVKQPHGYSQTIINSANSTGFYNVQDITTTVVQILPGESAKVIFDRINSAWIVYKI